MSIWTYYQKAGHWYLFQIKRHYGICVLSMNKTQNVFKASFEQVIFFMNNTYVHLATKTTLLDQDQIAHKIPFSSFYFLWSLIRDYSYRGKIGLLSLSDKRHLFSCIEQIVSLFRNYFPIIISCNNFISQLYTNKIK